MNNQVKGNLLSVFCLAFVLFAAFSGRLFAEDTAEIKTEPDMAVNSSMTSSAPAVSEIEANLADTKEIQQALTQAGFYKGPIDGVLGPKTKKAIRAFQEANSLTIDGKVGPRTRAKLKQHMAEPAKAAESIERTSPDGLMPTETATQAPAASEDQASEDLRQKLI
jgi:peptidoglycan hydrolase-like protein with peptidoglycan-binding domain